MAGWLSPDGASSGNQYALTLSPYDGNTNNFHTIIVRTDGKYQWTVGDNSNQRSGNSQASHATGSNWDFVVLTHKEGVTT